MANAEHQPESTRNYLPIDILIGQGGMNFEFHLTPQVELQGLYGSVLCKEFDQ